MKISDDRAQQILDSIVDSLMDENYATISEVARHHGCLRIYAEGGEIKMEAVDLHHSKAHTAA